MSVAELVVAAIESGERSASYPEILALSVVFGVPQHELLAGDGMVIVSPQQATSLFYAEPGHSAVQLGGRIPLESLRQASQLGYLMAASYTGAQGTMSGDMFDIAIKTGSFIVDDDTRKAAKRLGVTAEQVGAAAQRLWGQTLALERDDRLGDIEGLPARTVQARRGHVTRRLISELRTYMADQHQAPEEGDT